MALVLGVLAVPAVLTDAAHDASEAGGHDHGAAWHGLYDGSLAGLELTLIVAGVLLIAPLALRGAAAGRTRNKLLALGTATGVLSVLMVAPFLHGSARNQAFQADAAKVAPAGTTSLPKAPPKVASASTWLFGTAETALVIVVMAGGYRVSGRMARRRSAVRPVDAVLADA